MTKLRTLFLTALCSAGVGCGDGTSRSVQVRGAPADTPVADGRKPEALFLRTFPEPDHPTPDTLSIGRFEQRRGCVVFITEDGEALSPISPLGTMVRPAPTGRDGAFVLQFPDGGRVESGMTVEVKGAESEYGDPSEIPETCPKRTLMLGGIR